MKIISIPALSFILLLSACSPPTTITKTWTDPSVTPTTWKPFNKVLVIAKLRDVTSNHIAEDKIVASFKNKNAVASYTYLQSGDTVQTTVDAKLQQEGFDGLVTMQLLDVEKSVDVYNSGYGYGYGYGYGGFYAPYGGMTTVSTNHNYVVESRIYALSSGKLLWSGTTSSFNPNSLEDMMDQIIAAIKDHLVKQKLMQP